MRRHLQDVDAAAFQPGAPSRSAYEELQCVVVPLAFALRRSRSAASAFLFGSSEDDPFAQKIKPWNSKCPRWMPGYGTRSHGFCRKLKPLKKKWFPPEEPEPTETRPTPVQRPPAQTRPSTTRTAAAGAVAGVAAAATVHHHRSSPSSSSPWEQPASEARQEQAQANTEKPQVPFTAPVAPPPPRRVPRHPTRVPPTPPEALQGGLSPPPPPQPQSRSKRRPRKQSDFAEEEPSEPRPGLIVEAKTKPAPPSSDERPVGTFEDDVPEEEKMLPPAAKDILKNQLSPEAIEAGYEQERRDSLPKEVPGTTPQGPFWPPPSTAPPVQPIPPRPGETNYNYGWVPPQERVPYTPPWPGGGPATAVDRAEAVVEEVNDEANAVIRTAEDALVNTTV